MPTVKGIAFYVGLPTRMPFTDLTKTGIRNPASIAKVFREALLNSQNKFTVNLEMNGQSLLHCAFVRCGQTAGFARWFRVDRTEGVTVYLSGLDKNDEELAGRALASTPHPIPLQFWYEALNAQRPIHASFLITTVAAKDLLLAQAATLLGISFFSNLGLTE